MLETTLIHNLCKIPAVHVPLQVGAVSPQHSRDSAFLPHSNHLPLPAAGLNETSSIVICCLSQTTTEIIQALEMNELELEQETAGDRAISALLLAGGAEMHINSTYACGPPLDPYRCCAV